MLESFFHKKESDIVPILKKLSGYKTAILVSDGFEASELFEPKKALEEAGCEVHIISLSEGKIRSFCHNSWGKAISVDFSVHTADPREYDYLMLPGGALNSDHLRQDATAIAFMQNFIDRKRPIAAICHGVQPLIETHFLRGKTLTSWPSIRTDITNAGAIWIDKEVVSDHRLVTSRGPADLKAFNEVMLREFTAHKVHEAIPNIESYVATL